MWLIVRGQRRWAGEVRVPALQGVYACCALIVVLLASSGCGGGGAASHGSSQSSPSTGTGPPTSQPPPTVAPAPRFSATAAGIGSARRAAMIHAGSWRPGCPVAISDLRVLRVGYWGFDAHAHTGTLVVNQRAVEPMVGAFRALWRSRFPIRRMSPVEAYGASDERSMRADNTSAFNCRGVPGSTVWSQHAYGLAIDLNPLENPEVRNGVIDPPTAARYADRRLHTTGMIHPGDAAVRAFTAIGWGWGGSWHSLKDWQHFSANGL